MTESPPSPTPEPAQPEGPTTGWVAPQLPVRQPSPFRSAATRARWLVWLLIANVIVMIVSVGISLWGKAVITGYEAGEGTIADIDRFDAVFALSGIVALTVWVPTVIAWLAWSSRTVDNEDALGIGPSRITPRWAMGWWFVPFANLVMPYRTHREIYDRYHGAAAAGAGIVLLWWLVYITDNILGNIVGRVWVAAETVPELQTGLSLYVVSDLLTAVSGILAITLVRKIQARADLLAATPAPGAPGAAPSVDPVAAPGGGPVSEAREPSVIPTEPIPPAPETRRD